MKILVLNCGSSSVKYKLIDTVSENVMAEGGVEKIGLNDGFLKFKLSDGSKQIKELGLVDHEGAVAAILNVLTDAEYGCIGAYGEIDAVGHRLVHGGTKFSGSVLITDEVKEMVRECYPLAPLHNPANMTGVEAIDRLMPDVPQVGVFDTAFHQTMPAKAYMYALPYKFYEEAGVRRYGFHGTSHRYVSQRVCEMLGVDIKTQKIVTCHIGNGGSITAVDGGKSVDTSMGFTPLAGLPMGTRSGDLDAGILQYVMNKHGLDIDEMLNVLNKKSGVEGLSCVSSDFRDLESAAAKGDKKAELAQEKFAYEVKKYVGAYAAAMGGVDAVIFTAGVGENDKVIRAMVCEGLEYMGVKLDAAANDVRGKETVLSTPDSKVKVLLIPTNEELMIAMDTAGIVKK